MQGLGGSSQGGEGGSVQGPTGAAEVQGMLVHRNGMTAFQTHAHATNDIFELAAQVSAGKRIQCGFYSAFLCTPESILSQAVLSLCSLLSSTQTCTMVMHVPNDMVPL